MWANLIYPLLALWWFLWEGTQRLIYLKLEASFEVSKAQSIPSWHSTAHLCLKIWALRNCSSAFPASLLPYLTWTFGIQTWALCGNSQRCSPIQKWARARRYHQGYPSHPWINKNTQSAFSSPLFGLPENDFIYAAHLCPLQSPPGPGDPVRHL